MNDQVKCDESRPTCENCKRCSHECKWPVVQDALVSRTRLRENHSALVVSPSNAGGRPRDHAPIVSNNPSSNPTRRNGKIACTGCRAARCRCTQERPFCARCRELGITCTYQPISSTVDQSVHENVSETLSPQTSTGADRLDTSAVEK